MAEAPEFSPPVWFLDRPDGGRLCEELGGRAAVVVSADEDLARRYAGLVNQPGAAAVPEGGALGAFESFMARHGLGHVLLLTRGEGGATRETLLDAATFLRLARQRPAGARA